MPKIDLTQNYRFGGKLYRKGKAVDVPAEFAKLVKGGAPGTASGATVNEGEGVTDGQVDASATKTTAASTKTTRKSGKGK